MRSRVVHPEILDELPHDHPDAIASRKDLVRINSLMGNYRWLHRMLDLHAAVGDTVVELGAGDGVQASKYGLGEKAGPQKKERPSITGMDLAPRPDGWPASWGWIRGDLQENLGENPASVVVASLMLHHFDTGGLARLGKLLSLPERRLLIFSEPARRNRHHWQGRALALLGLNRVTRHDMHVSIDAGFLGSEMEELLGLDRTEWQIEVTVTFLGAYRFLARRVGSEPMTP